MKLGIVGLPNVGKSTLFNSLTKAGAESANYPFCTIDPNVGVVTVPDKRLDVLGEMYHTKKIIPAAIEFVDIAGLVKGASKGEGLGNQFLANIREVDAIVHVVRCFEDPNVIHVDGSIDPLRDIETIDLELIFADLEVLERRISKTAKSARMDKEAAKELEFQERLKKLLEDGKDAILMELQNEDEEKWIAEYNLLTEGADVQGMYSVYQEGIYLGYRYFETRYEDVVMGTANAGDYDWAKTVAYPFGYGDSYTDFTYSNFNVTESDDAFDISLTVTNSGKTYSGKETVQVYFQSPYTAYDKANGIEKAAAELCGFAKTDVLAPGASEDVTITVPKSELRTYDANNAKTYIVDAGDYYFTAATDSHNAVNNILAAKGYTVENTNGRMTENGNTDLVWKWTNDTLDTTTFSNGANGTAITNLFDESDPNKSSDAPGSVTWMSRSDWTGTIPTAPAQLTANETLAASLAFTKYDGSEANSVEMPTLGAKNGLTLASMIGKDFDDPEWDTLLDQLTYSEMVNTITLGFHNTAAAASIGKTATKDENGPQGLTAALTGGASAMCYTSEDVMAATFNVDLINEVGRCIGEDCLAMGYSGLYGPGINMHRTAYSGRNFEYYSEDPFVAGTICAAEVQGIQSKGVYVYLKHVALNDSETSRRGVNTWLNEQTAREIYLEVADKAITDGGAWSVMTGFNRWGATWCGANANLLTGFLRGELGMRGMCITDFSGSSQYMDLVDGLIAGSDIWDSPMPKIHTTKAANYENDAYIVTQMRNAMHHILYTVVNSNAMNGWASTDTLKTITPWWQTAIYALIAVLAVLTILCAWQLSKALKAKKSMVDTAPAADQK